MCQWRTRTGMSAAPPMYLDGTFQPMALGMPATLSRQEASLYPRVRRLEVNKWLLRVKSILRLLRLLFILICRRLLTMALGSNQDLSTLITPQLHRISSCNQTLLQVCSKAHSSILCIPVSIPRFLG